MENHVYALIQQMADSDPDIRRQSILNLKRSDLTGCQQEVIPHIIASLGDEHIAVREAAEDILITLGGRDVVNALIPCLSDTSTTILNYAIEILSQVGGGAIDLILPLLESKDHDIRKFGCDILGNLKYSQSVYELIELLGDPHVNVAIAAGEALGKIGNTEAVPYLIRALKHPDTWMKCIAAEALGKIGDLRAVDPFINMSVYEDPIVLYTVIKAMGNFQDQRVLPYILSIVNANPMFVPSAAQAVEHLAIHQGERIYQEVKTANIGEHFIRLLTSENLEVLRSAITIVGHLQLIDAVHPLGQLLEHPDQDIVELATAALVNIGQTGLDEIHTVFTRIFDSLQPETLEQAEDGEPPPSAKIPIVKVLGEIGSQQSVNLLTHALDENIADEIRIEAATALGKILSRIPDLDQHIAHVTQTDDLLLSGIQRLIDVLSDPCDALRISAAEALGESGIPLAYNPLVQLLRDPVVATCEAASLALPKIRQLSQEEKLRPLHHILVTSAQEEFPETARAAALRAIYRIAGDREITFIIPYLQDASSAVRVAAVEALRTCSPSVSHCANVLELLTPLLHDPDVQVRISALQSFMICGTQQLNTGPEVQHLLFQTLLNMFQDDHPRVQYETCQQLAKLVPGLHLDQETGERVIDALITIVQDKETLVKIAAIEAFTTLQPYIESASKAASILQHLMRHTNDPELRTSLRHALAVLEPS